MAKLNNLLKTKKPQEGESSNTIKEAAPQNQPSSIQSSEEENEFNLSPLESDTSHKRIPRIFKKIAKPKKEKSDFTPDGHAIDALMQENRHAELLLKESRRAIKKLDRADLEIHWRDLGLLVTELKDIEFHYQRKEELLFPRIKSDHSAEFLNKFIEQHKEVKKDIRNLLQAIKNKNLKNVKHIFIQLSDQIHDCILKEEQVLIPMALSELKDEDWQEIRTQGKTIGYSWIEKDQDPLALHLKSEGIKLDGFRLESGFLSINQIDQVLNLIPAEITIVNEEGLIVYYNKENNRYFKRQPDFIGEKYLDCLTGKSEKYIKKIIDSFKKKEQNNISLRFQNEQKTLYIQYKPLYFKNGDYHGFIEIATDIGQFEQLDIDENVN